MSASSPQRATYPQAVALRAVADGLVTFQRVDGGWADWCPPAGVRRDVVERLRNRHWIKVGKRRPMLDGEIADVMLTAAGEIALALARGGTS